MTKERTEKCAQEAALSLIFNKAQSITLNLSALIPGHQILPCCQMVLESHRYAQGMLWDQSHDALTAIMDAKHLCIQKFVTLETTSCFRFCVFN